MRKIRTQRHDVRVEISADRITLFVMERRINDVPTEITFTAKEARTLVEWLADEIRTLEAR